MISRLLLALGKTDRKVVAVFASSAESAEAQVAYVRSNLPLPVWLYCVTPCDVHCDRMVVEASPVRLWLRAQRELWAYKVALAVTEWNGGSGPWLVKAAPFTIPFFRALVRTKDGGFFAGSPQAIFHYAKVALLRTARDIRVRGGEIALGSALKAFAFFAQWNSSLSRALFRRVHGTKHLSIDGQPRGEGIAVYRYQGRQWNAPRIASLEGRYIFFQRDTDASTPDHLLSLFEDTNTFVVSRQHAVRSWRKLLFATAPFRKLQSGEATRVHAPVSPAMLVDAAKLRALGIRSLSSFGSNWFVLFHQAAAAGWHSYSIGGGPVPTELAAVPYDEAEFVKTVIDEPDLRILAPQNKELSRGNIARSVANGPGFRGLPRVLLVSPYLPFPLSHGGAVRIWNLCRSLSDRIDFTLACFREKTDTVQYDKLHEVFRDVYVVDIDEKHHDASLPKPVNGYESSTMRELIRTLPADILQLEYTQLARYREAKPGTPAILVEHDLTFTLYRQLAKNKEYEQWLAFERERFGRFESIWTMSPFDRQQAIAEGSPSDRTVVVPNGVDLDRFRCPAADAQSLEVLYVGSFRHLPNFLAFEELRLRIMPQVWKAVPHATLQVIGGPDHLAFWPGSRELDARITVHGFIADLVPFYTSAAVVVVPLPVSAGTNIKLMEALSCERPVVSTPVGCAGLELQDGRELLVRDLGIGFSAAVAELLGNPTKRSQLAARGLAEASARFGWNAIAGSALNSYEALLASAPFERSERRL